MWVKAPTVAMSVVCSAGLVAALALPVTMKAGSEFVQGAAVKLSVNWDRLAAFDAIPAYTQIAGGDVLGANVPAFLNRLVARRPTVRVILAASDALAAFGGKSVLAEMGLAVTLITGPCTDTPTIERRTRDLCGIPAMKLAKGEPVLQF